LTEKIARRGYHLSREYSVDPLEIVFVREVMRTNIVAFRSSQTLAEVAAVSRPGHLVRGQHLYPVLQEDSRLAGVLTRKDIARAVSEHSSPDTPVGSLARHDTVVARPDEPLRAIVNRMAETGYTRMPVLASHASAEVVGMISLEDLLRARARNLTEERHRERVIRIRLPFGVSSQPTDTGPDIVSREQQK
jgi:CBS domain-containing protein